jgi:hypothetical protein
MKAQLSKEKILIHEPSCARKPEWPKILRILITRDFTKVDFGYHSNKYYGHGGWIRIQNKSFIRDQAQKQYKFLTIQKNYISIAP